jgi:hypothetical protein
LNDDQTGKDAKEGREARLAKFSINLFASIASSNTFWSQMQEPCDLIFCVWRESEFTIVSIFETMRCQVGQVWPESASRLRGTLLP